LFGGTWCDIALFGVIPGQDGLHVAATPRAPRRAFSRAANGYRLALFVTLKPDDR
jgi:hypothetical protein